MKQRIAKTTAFLLSLKADSIDGSEDREVVLVLRGKETRFNGLQYLLGFAYPDFYFHVTTAYAILRANGVDIGKADYLGNP